MIDSNKNFSNLLKKVKLLLKEQKEKEILDLLENSQVYSEWYNHDNWNGGIDFYNIHINADVATYVRLKPKAEKIKKQIENLFKEVSDDNAEKYDNVILGFHDSERKLDIENLLGEDEPNEIPFFVVIKKEHTNSNSYNSHNTPQKLPSFILVHNDGWNDYGAYTTFSLFYYSSINESQLIGEIKIMQKDIKDTYSIIKKEFRTLPSSFCSLGVRPNYYRKMQEVFKGDSLILKKIMAALRDVSYFSQIADHFASNDIYNQSLLRENNSERALREGFYLVQGRDITNSYHFTYQFHPPYGNEYVQIQFPFKSNCYDFERIYGLIGENGTGKTSLLKSIPEMIKDDNNNCFIGEKPLFSQIITVSYSPFDNFGSLDGNLTFKYIFCGLNNGFGGNVPHEELVRRCTRDFSKLRERGFEDFWEEAITDVIRIEILEKCIEKDENKKKFLKIESLNKIFSQLSSGEANYLISMTALIANIRYDSLLLFDEPEQHLHPKAITSLMMRIGELLVKFESYAIIATHSTLVIRELISANVYILKRNKEVLNISKIGIESFGEDIAILNDIIFGNEDQIKRFQKYLKQLIDDNPESDYNEILAKIENGYLPLGMNAKILIRRLIMERDGLY